MAEPVLLISSDPYLGASLEAVAHGRIQVAHLDPTYRPPTWPAVPEATVVLDVTPRLRDSVHTWIRAHHPGPLVILLKPGERSPIAPDGGQVLGRPFRLIDLVDLLERPPVPEAVGEEEESEQEEHAERDAEEFAPEPTQPQPQEGEPHPAPGKPHPAPGEPHPDPDEGRPDPGPPPQEGQGEPHPAPANDGPPFGRVAEPGGVFSRLSTPLRGMGAARAPRGQVAGRPPQGLGAGRPPHGQVVGQRPTPPPTEPAGRLPRPDWPTAATQLGLRRRRRTGRRVRRVATRVLLVVVVALVVGGGWLGLGLAAARQDLLVGAAGVRDELARADAALARGRPDEAEAAVQAAQRSLAVAATVPERRELRVAARLPVLSGGIADTRRLLVAAGGLTGAGERAVAVVLHLRAGPAALLRGDRFDLDALDDATAQAKRMVAELEAAWAQLQEIRGGPLEPGVDETRRWALGQLDEALGRARPLAATLDALPAALGVGEPRRYLIVLARPAGGAPLAAREVVLDKGVIDLGPPDDQLTGALRDPGPKASFPATGKAMLRAAGAQGRPRPDAVIAMDPRAMRMLLAATGPVAVPGYGQIDAADAVASLTRPPDPRYRQAVLATLVARFLSGHDVVATGRVLGAAGAGHNVRAYAADPGLQRLLASHRLDGTGQPRR